LTEAVVAKGGVPVASHPSSFWFAGERLLLTVYVGDLLLSGPEDNHDKFWAKLRSGPNPVEIDEPEPLDRFLGRRHTVEDTPQGKLMSFDMEDYCVSAVSKYTEMTGVTKMKPASTPLLH
jgi:hypothetical protein